MNINKLTPTIDELLKEIASLRQENEEYRRFASIPLQNPTPVFEFDSKGRLSYLNPAAQQLLNDLNLADASPFLPDDLIDLLGSASNKNDAQFTREIKIDGHIFEEKLCHLQEFNTLHIYATDITQRRQLEEALNRSKQELMQSQEFIQSATMGMGVLFATIDKNFCYTYFNQAYQEELKRLSGKDIATGMNILDVFAHLPEQKKIVEQRWVPVLHGERTSNIVRFGDQGVYQRVYNVLHSPILDAGGNVVGAGEVMTDITELELVQEALRQSDARFRLVLKNVPVFVTAQDKDLHFIWTFNEKLINREELIGKTDLDIFPQPIASWLMDLKLQVLDNGSELNVQEWITFEGQQLFLDIFLEPIRNEDGQITGVGMAAVDLTPTKLAERALKYSEERYRSLFDAMNEGFAIHELIYDQNGIPCDYRFLDFNPAFERLTGLKREQVIGKTYRQVMPQEGDRWLNNYAKVVLTGEPAQFEDYSPSLNKHYEIFAYRYAPNQFATIFLEVTKHRQMEDDLRINLTKYSVLFDSFPMGITVSDKNGQILEANQEASKLLGLSREEQSQRHIAGTEWRIIRPDKAPMPPDEFASVRALKEQRRIENIEMGIVKEDDQVTWISVTASPLPLNDFGVVITYNDITKRILAEEALHQAREKLEITVQERTEELTRANNELKLEVSERKRIEAELILQTRTGEAQRQRFNDVLEILPAYLILLTPDYHVAFANRYFRERFGEDHGRHCYEYLFGRAGPCVNCETFKVVDIKTSHNWEWTGPDGHHYDVFDFPFTDADGSSLILEMGIDITGRKLAEEKLRSLNAYNRRLIEANLDALVTITPDGKIGDVNAVTESITGFPRQELISTDFHSYFTDPKKAREGYEKVFETGMVRDYELEIQHRDGHITPVVYNASLYRDESGQVAGVFAAARDISERKQSERQLIILTTALEAAANGIILSDKDGNILWSNPAFSEMTGYSRDEIIGKNPRFLKSGKQEQEFYRHMWETILAGQVWRGELVNCRKDKSLYHEEQTITPVFDKQGKVTNFISIRQDITVHKQAEEALKKSEAQYRSLVTATTQIVWETNAAGDVIVDIPTWRAYTGQLEQEIMGRGWINAIHPDDQLRTAAIWLQAVENRTLYETEYRIKNAKGEYGDFSVRGAPVIGKDGNVSGWIGTSTDITEKKNIENQLLMAEKHAAIGRMVGSVTHEINNPLQTIKNCLYLIQQDTSPDSTIVEPLDMALSETQRLSNIVGQLRQLYRPRAVQMIRRQNLLELIEEVYALITPHLSNSRVTWQPLPGLRNANVDCIKDQIIEVLLNLSMNAVEAMQPDGGILSVNMVSSIDNSQVGVVIRDTGPGINPEILAHIFEPFITTKDYGMGLGLSICYGIIQKHGGQITVESESGQGTSFTIWLPEVG